MKWLRSQSLQSVLSLRQDVAPGMPVGRTAFGCRDAVNPSHLVEAACVSSVGSLCWGDQSLAVSWKNRLLGEVAPPPAPVGQALRLPGRAEQGLVAPEVQDLATPPWESVTWVRPPWLQALWGS